MAARCERPKGVVYYDEKEEEEDETKKIPDQPRPVLSWVTQNAPLCRAQVLTADHPRAATPPGFRGSLKPPQATLLQAMLDLEALGGGNGFVVEPPRGLPATAYFQTRYARIAAVFSFGKTVLCISLICKSTRPPSGPIALNQITRFIPPKISRNQEVEGVAIEEYGLGVFPTAQMHYSRNLRATLVVAASSVITQWDSSLQRFAPGLKRIIIDNVWSLRVFSALFHTPAFDEIDVVLLKAGLVTENFVVPGEQKQQGGGPRALTKVLSIITEGCVWARTIVDDFDTLRLSVNDIFPPAYFTWIISATDRKTMVKDAIVPATTVAGFIRANASVPILSAAHSWIFRHALKLRCCHDYVQEYINTTTIDYRRIIVRGGRAVELLQGLGIENAVLEMIAAGAIETAAEHLNIKVNTIEELVERVLATRVGKYRKAVWAISRVRRARAIAARSEYPQDSNEQVKTVRNTLKHGSDAEVEAVLARLGRSGPLLLQALSSLEEWGIKEKKEHGDTLQRMRDNVNQDMCSSCMVPISEEGGESYIVNCCQIIICGHCAVVKRKDQEARQYITRCPHCARNIDPRKYLIYVGADLTLDMTTLADEAIFNPQKEARAEEEACAEKTTANTYSAWDDNPRLRALLQLICDDPIQSISDEPVVAFIDGLLDGQRDIQHPTDAPHRNMVFAMFPESMKQISAAFGVLNIKYAVLSGCRKKKDETVRRFQSGEITTMVVNSSRDCAGLHLPEVTRLILYHRHIDKNIAKQCVGRAQRIGRTSSLQVIELLDESERRRFE